jgi:acyl-CoA hydrolase
LKVFNSTHFLSSLGKIILKRKNILEMSEKRSSLISLRFLAEPTDVNFGGKVHGGTVMKWIDQAGYYCAAAWSHSYCVTVYVGGIRFLKPIPIGHIVTVDAKVIYTGRTSMHIMVDVFSGDPKKKERIKTTNCIIIFVAVDEDGQPTPVEKWIPAKKQEKRLEEYAKVVMERRKSIQEAREELFGSDF